MLGVVLVRSAYGSRPAALCVSRRCLNYTSHTENSLYVIFMLAVNSTDRKQSTIVQLIISAIQFSSELYGIVVRICAPMFSKTTLTALLRYSTAISPFFWALPSLDVAVMHRVLNAGRYLRPGRDCKQERKSRSVIRKRPDIFTPFGPLCAWVHAHRCKILHLPYMCAILCVSIFGCIYSLLKFQLVHVSVTGAGGMTIC